MNPNQNVATKNITISQINNADGGIDFETNSENMLEKKSIVLGFNVLVRTPESKAELKLTSILPAGMPMLADGRFVLSALHPRYIR